MKWYKILLLSILGGLILALAWYPHGVPFLVFFAFIPLLFISDSLLQGPGRAALWKGFIASYPAFVTWNAVTTYWIVYCTVPGGIAAVLLNAMLQALVFGLWHCCRKRIPQQWMHPIVLVAFWISFEYLHLNWDLTWPWLNLGNVFASCPRYVQWYSVTGAFGGTVWILSINILLYHLIRNWRKNRKAVKVYAVISIGLFICPVIISGCMYRYGQKHIQKSEPVNVVVVQPNTDVWTEEYQLSNAQHIGRILKIVGPKIDGETDLVVCPESSIPHTLPLAAVQQKPMADILSLYGGFAKFDSLIAQYPDLHFILGLSTYEIYECQKTASAQPVGNNLYADQFNTAVCYGKGQYAGHHHKCRLVPGVEAMPFPKLFGFLSDLLIDLGGSSTSLGKDTGCRVFPIDVNGRNINIGTDICYESIYGELSGRFVRNGANLITVITNDSWWKDSPGHMQHFEMSRLRAVESRRYVVRAANGGTSGIIDPLGNVQCKTDYGGRAVFKATVYAQQGLSFYARHGDYLAWLAIVLAGLSAGYSILLLCLRLFGPKSPTKTPSVQ